MTRLQIALLVLCKLVNKASDGAAFFKLWSMSKALENWAWHASWAVRYHLAPRTPSN